MAETFASVNQLLDVYVNLGEETGGRAPDTRSLASYEIGSNPLHFSQTKSKLARLYSLPLRTRNISQASSQNLS